MTTEDKDSLKPIAGADRGGRQRLDLKGEFLLALFPTVTILLVLWTVEAVADRRVLFAALASSAFLIYLDPMHGTNTIRVLVPSHVAGALAGMAVAWVLGSGYGAAGLAMVATILIMILADIVHPPAIGTCLSFAYSSGLSANLSLFLLALGMVAVLAILQRVVTYVLSRLST